MASLDVLEKGHKSCPAGIRFTCMFPTILCPKFVHVMVC